MSDTFTIGQFIDAIEKNGLTQGRGTLWRTSDGEDLATENDKLGAYDYEDGFITDEVIIGEACAMGQGYINIGGFADNDAMTDLSVYSIWNQIMNRVVNLNDNYKRTLGEIAEMVREDFVEFLDVEIPFKEFDFTPYLPKGFKHD